MTTQFVLSDSRYSASDISALLAGNPGVSTRGTTVTVHADLTPAELAALQAAIAAGEGIYEFRGVRVRSSADVDNVVSEAIKEAIAPGRPANLQGEAEKALLAKIAALNAKASLGLTLSTEEQTYLQEKLTFYATVVQPIRDEGDVFNAARGW